MDTALSHLSISTFLFLVLLRLRLARFLTQLMTKQVCTQVQVLTLIFLTYLASKELKYVLLFLTSLENLEWMEVLSVVRMQIQCGFFLTKNTLLNIRHSEYSDFGIMKLLCILTTKLRVCLRTSLCTLVLSISTQKRLWDLQVLNRLKELIQKMSGLY